MNIFIRWIKRLFGKNKVKYLTAHSVSEVETNKMLKSNDEKNNEFKEKLICQADPDINYGNGYKIKKVFLKDMV